MRNFFKFIATYLRLLLPPNIFWLRNRFNEIRKMQEFLLERQYFYRIYPQERCCCFYRPFFSSENLESALPNLLSGLSKTDQEKLLTILCRIQTVCNTTHKYLDIFSPEEKAEIRQNERLQNEAILQLSANHYRYRNYHLPVKEFDPSVFLGRHGLGTLNDHSYFRDKDIIDAGGYIGDSVLILAPLTSRTVYSFEPNPHNYQLMLQTLQLNKIHNAVAENLALGAENKIANLSGEGPGALLSGEKAKNGNHEISLCTLDSYVQQHSLKVGLIKVDIEGAEQEFLAGAKTTILRDRPILLISIYHNLADFLHIKPLIESWNAGYTFSIFHYPVQIDVAAETLLIAKPANGDRCR